MNTETAARHRSRSISMALAAATILGGFVVGQRHPAATAAGLRSIQIDGVDELVNRNMNPRWADVLARLESFEYVILSPASGPEPVDGADPGASGYAPPNPDVEDFALRVQAKGKRALGWLPLSMAARAGDYQRAGLNGIFTDGCPGPAELATILGSWPGAFVVAGAASCPTPGLAAVVDPANVDSAHATSAIFDPNAGYPVAEGPKLGVPAYFTDDAQWERLLAGISDIGAVVVNASDAEISALRPKLRRARAGGARVYRYIETGYLTKSANAFPARGATTFADADFDGVFLDEVRSGCSVFAEATYRSYWNNAVAAGKGLIYNPGQTMGKCFTTISTTAVNFEGTFASYQNWPASEWGRMLPASKQWQIIHATPMAGVAAAAALAKARNAGLIWVAPTNNWSQFPGDAYFNALRQAVTGALTPPPTSEATTTTTTTTVAVTTAASTATTTTVTTISNAAAIAATTTPGSTNASTTTGPTTAATTAPTTASTRPASGTGSGASGSTSGAGAATSGATSAAATPAETTTSPTVTSVAVTTAPSTSTPSAAATTTTVTKTTVTPTTPTIAVTTTIPTTTAPRTTAAPALSPATAATGKLTLKSTTKRICVQTARRGRRTVCVRYKKLVVRAKHIAKPKPKTGH